MKMTRRNFISASAAAMLACGASLSAHAAENTTENGLNFITDIFKDPTQPGETEGATTITAETNAEWYEKLDFSDRREFANAERGWLDNAEGRIIDGDDNRSAWDLQSYGDLNRDAPDTVNPSLWRNTQLNAKAGLFEVCDGIYQVRGFDMANTTFIRTDHGWIVFDVLMCKENMKAAKELMENRFGPLDIKAVLYSHSHVDHFGGVEGVITREQVADAKLSLKKQLASGKTLVLAPAGFLKHAISENVYAGIAMARRAQFQYGTVLDKGEKGALSVGIGMGQSTGTVTLIAPTYEIGEDVPKLTIDGLEIEFQLTPGTEAPAEMNAYFPKYRALWMAENCTGTLHNLYTLRGAEVRDANDWAKYIIEADQRFCSKTDVVFQSHNWPHWGEEIHEYLLNTAAIYKFIHDQTLHYMNQGYTSTEVAAMLTLPEKLEKVWYTRPYYGTLAHNAKAVYQKYLGWYDANPVNLNPLPPSDTAKKLVEYLGSTDAVLRKAWKDFEKGDYQWVAQITKELVFADPSNQKARNLCADALEQLGYQAESGAWRNAYLMGAAELRKGNLSGLARTANGLGSAMKEMTVDMLLDYISILTDANAAQNDDVTLNLIVTDVNEKFYVTRKNGILLSYSGENRPDAQATVTCKRLQLLALMQGQQAGQVQVSGDATALKRLLAYASKFEKTFNVIEP